MKFIHRLGFYLGGFSIGLVFLAFFLSGKRTSCDYGPEARVLKNINSKKQAFSEEATLVINELSLDTTYINNALRHGNVNFGNSQTKLDSCRIYAIEQPLDEDLLIFKVRNCDSLATILSITKK